MTKKDAKNKGAIKPKDAKKLVEDQMFGMKNKGKSAKLKKLASSLEASYTKGKAKPHEGAKLPEAQEVYQKIPVGMDPKAVLCINFKNGVCSKKEACKFSHELDQDKRLRDLQLAAESAKEKEKEREKEGAVRAEGGADAKGQDSSKEEKICKYYIDALKSGKHNPKWTCPNGHSCQGKHSPPEGYVLKESDQADITIEEYIENERNKLPEKQTPMTEDLFHTWKKDREAQLLKEQKEKEKVKEGNIRLGKILPSGKDLFVYKIKQFVDDEEALDFDYNAREEDIESDEEKNLEDGLKHLEIAK
ncbi:hypothetical protein NECID01_0879 [Nematocida sp. AWRm77]|nr:hypothetical protein NECID01_0879 [Nematocida sp. AWRm77]